MMIHDRKAQDVCELDVDGVSMKFSQVPQNIKASIHIFHTLLESYENSWGTMVALRRTSAVKETYLLTSSRFLRRGALLQGSTKYLIRIGTGAVFGPASAWTLL